MLIFNLKLLLILEDNLMTKNYVSTFKLRSNFFAMSFFMNRYHPIALVYIKKLIY